MSVHSRLDRTGQKRTPGLYSAVLHSTKYRDGHSTRCGWEVGCGYRNEQMMHRARWTYTVVSVVWHRHKTGCIVRNDSICNVQKSFRRRSDSTSDYSICNDGRKWFLVTLHIKVAELNGNGEGHITKPFRKSKPIVEWNAVEISVSTIRGTFWQFPKDVDKLQGNNATPTFSPLEVRADPVEVVKIRWTHKTIVGFKQVLHLLPVLQVRFVMRISLVRLPNKHHLFSKAVLSWIVIYEHVSGDHPVPYQILFRDLWHRWLRLSCTTSPLHKNPAERPRMPRENLKCMREKHRSQHPSHAAENGTECPSKFGSVVDYVFGWAFRISAVSFVKTYTNPPITTQAIIPRSAHYNKLVAGLFLLSIFNDSIGVDNSFAQMWSWSNARNSF